ncbi:hypothetical protein PENARI_c002G01501 [Penicillium arizonense]|uniref:Putative gamma-glutamylcyclotransferase n=1 Tax=Penicillium arizonense TaxID=1835702 RepID=A0A1F5LUR5_PENAI|nr:hypothetical protein PENARI_c002G01501 [Penicillium arizonense]OGE56907.1 hypothetical protein PENARI_c002G01501 [Penicillium arizonense]
MGDNTLFFYGTLMAPQVLYRVIHGQANPEPWQKAMLSFQPAILYGYRRHRVRFADYPGIVPVTGTESDNKPSTPSASSASSAAPTSTHNTVLGILVTGLTEGDIHRLDKFEGSEYTHRKVTVRTLRTVKHAEAGEARDTLNDGGEEHLKDVLDAASAENTSTTEGEEVDAMTYEWIGGTTRLEEAEWDFETFKKERMAWWVGADESEW